jgi:glutamine cyclotransferase
MCLNGIAHNGEKGTLLVTGKNWPSLWHIKLVSTK